MEMQTHTFLSSITIYKDKILVTECRVSEQQDKLDHVYVNARFYETQKQAPSYNPLCMK